MYRFIAYRGFESPSLRQDIMRKFLILKAYAFFFVLFDGAKWGKVGFEMTAFLPAFQCLDMSSSISWSLVRGWDLKKISRSRARWLNNHAIRVAARRRRLNRRLLKRIQKYGPDWAVWLAPEMFSLEKVHRSKFLSKLQLLRRMVSTAKGPLRIDFSRTAKLASGATLLFTAELRRLFTHFPASAKSIRCTLSHQSKVNQVLKQIGLLNLLRKSSVRIEPRDSDVVHWKFTHGNKVEGIKFDEVLAGLTTRIEDQIQTELYEGFIEAMNNVMHHAYIGVREDGMGLQDNNDWWMFSQLRDNAITVVFCDLGIGIPKTLPIKKKALWKRLISLNLTSDADAIEHALQDSVTRTRQKGRGRGLTQLVDVVRKTPTGRVSIFSNCGAVHFKVGNDLKKNNHSDSICGTLIQWTIPVLTKDGVSNL